MKNNASLIDSNVLIAAYQKSNSQHEKASRLLWSLRELQPKTNPLVAQEVCTVLLLRTNNLQFVNQVTRDLFFDSQPLVKLSVLSTQLWQSAYQVFSTQPGSELSFADCSLIAQARLEGVIKIATLDGDLKKIYEGEFDFYS